MDKLPRPLRCLLCFTTTFLISFVMNLDALALSAVKFPCNPAGATGPSNPPPPPPPPAFLTAPLCTCCFLGADNSSLGGRQGRPSTSLPSPSLSLFALWHFEPRRGRAIPRDASTHRLEKPPVLLQPRPDPIPIPLLWLAKGSGGQGPRGLRGLLWRGRRRRRMCIRNLLSMETIKQSIEWKRGSARPRNSTSSYAPLLTCSNCAS